MSLPSILLTNFLLTLAAMLLLWALSLAKRNASVVDVYWGPGFALIAAVTYGLTQQPGPRPALITVMAALWGLRLGAYLWWRNSGKGEDFRYAAMRRQHGERFARVSLWTVFGLQAVLLWLVSLPLQVAQASTAPAQLGWPDAAGMGLWAAGMFFEVVGDWQLARFKADPANAGRVMDRGLWRYTRHPNYFGDFLVWWGFFVVALSAAGGVWTLVSPLLMSVLLMRVSGVPLLERSLERRRAGYRDYVERTSAFFPLPPSRSGAQS